MIVINSSAREVSYIKEIRATDLDTGEINPRNIKIEAIKGTYTLSKYDNLTHKERNPDGITFFNLKSYHEADIQKKFNLNMIELGRLMMLFTYASYHNNSNRMYLQLDNCRPLQYKDFSKILKLSSRTTKSTINKYINQKILFFDKKKSQYYFTDKYIIRGSIDTRTKRKKEVGLYRFYNKSIREIYYALNDISISKVKLLGLLMCITPYIRLIDKIAIEYNRSASNNMLVLSEYDEVNERYEAISQKMLAERLHISENSLVTYFKELNEIAKQTTGKHLIYKYNESLQAYGQRYKYTNEAIVINPKYTYSSDEQSSRYRNLVSAIEKAEGNILEFKQNNEENEELN
ncbi:hypothetical protein ACMGE6_12490 (plasmid) [Macrococcus equi]|uniref:hypothetical protein n=1 Tax=Macrococcus equi TaxID=3395462 RepID=UPI0039BDB100